MAARKPPARSDSDAASAVLKRAPVTPRAPATPSPLARAPSPARRNPGAAPPAPAPASSPAPTPAPDVTKAGTAPRARKTALKALVPSAVRPEGEPDAFIRDFKARWLARIDFKSESNVRSLLVLCALYLARGREREAEELAIKLIGFIGTKAPPPQTTPVLCAALHLLAWIKGKRGMNVAPLVERARLIARAHADRDRAWLSDEAPREIEDARQKKKLDALVEPFAGVLRWLNDPSGRQKAEQVLAQLLDVARALMTR